MTASFMKYRIKSNNENHTKQIANAISLFLNQGDLILLEGDLGAGKTHFVKGLAEGLGSKDIVTSPTFSLANFYTTNLKFELLHIDLYRISSIEEFSDLGLTDYFNQNIVIIEWGTKFSSSFDEYLLISFAYVNNHKDNREITFSYIGDKYLTKLELLEQILSNFTLC